jgi:hypothetical protein
MEFRSQINRFWSKKMAICLFFAIFVAKVEAGGIVTPSITAEPSNTNVLNGDTASFTMSAGCLLSAIGSVTWYYTNNDNVKPVATNTFLVSLLSVSSTLTINNVSSNNAGNYYAVVADLLGGTVKTSSATLGIIPPVTALTSESVMMPKGFKLQFSGPTGSNLVIEATSDMVHWSPISTNVITSGSVTYTDTVAKAQSSRFYRAFIK